MTNFITATREDLIKLAHSYGFRKESPTMMTRSDGAAIMFGEHGDFAFRRPDGSYGNCRAIAMSSYYRKYPLEYAIEIFTREFSKLDPAQRKPPLSVNQNDHNPRRNP